MNPPSQRWDRQTASVAALAACVSVVAFLITYRNGAVLLYGDAVAHINIARRVFDSQTPGLLQLGTVWLPLPHLLMMPLVASNWAWQTGVGGSLPSMAAYVFGVVGLFRLVRGAVANSTRGPSHANAVAILAAAMYGLNPNLLYLQSTAMTEPLYLALFIWTVVHFAEFVQELRANGWTTLAKRSLWKCGAVLATACLTRYDGWFLSAAVGALVLSIAWRADGARAGRTIVVFLFLAGTAPVLWFTYNAIVYGNALEFANGPYSAQAIEKKTAVPGFPPHPGTHNLPAAGLYFLKAAEFSVAEGNWERLWVLLALLGAGFVAFVDRHLAPLLLLLIPIPFYMLSVAYGGVPIFTPSWWPFSLLQHPLWNSAAAGAGRVCRAGRVLLRFVHQATGREVSDRSGRSRLGDRKLCGRMARAARVLPRGLDQFANASPVGELTRRAIAAPASEFDTAHVPGRACRRAAGRGNSTKAHDQ